MEDSNAQVLGSELRNRYEILEKLGAGGFGTIYKARQVATGQTVAIKVLHLAADAPASAQEKRLARFQREMQLCARVHHPNIVRLIDSGQAENGVVYTVFEYAPGKNLAQVLAEEGALEPGEARHLMIQLLDALACAHSMGVIHRDFKPANIMVVPTGARRNALVVDFGIGVLTEMSATESIITVSRESIGTPAYAAPEQLRGLAPDPRADLYAWGLIFLECLTGKRVIEGSTPADVIYKQLSPEPIPIPAALSRHPLGELLRRTTTKDPAARNVMADGLLRELEELDMSGLQLRAVSENLQRAAQTGETATSVPGSSPVGALPQILEGERRQITAVCCTLSAQALKPGAADLEEIDQLLGVQQEGCVGAARRFGGHVAGALGDTVVFYFGYPTAREDDARKAAQAALAILAETRARSEAFAAERQIRIDVRVGLHTGLVVARELNDPAISGLGYVMGPTPKHATRLSLLAAPNSIVLSGETRRLLRKEFLIEPSGIQVTDGGAPLETYILNEGAPTSPVDDLPFIGRSRELDALLDRWSRARGGTGQVILLNGEPGIGKSRLARAFGERIAGERHTWLECRCTPDSTNTAFFPIIDLLEQMLDPAREVKPEGKVERLEALLSLYGFELSESMPLFGQLLSITLPPQRWRPLDISPQKQRELTRNSVLSLLFEIAEREPVVLLIEDLHWADPSTLELLGHFASDAASARTLAIFTARPEFSPSWPPTAVSQIQLDRMARPEVEQIASKLTGGRALPTEVLDAVVNRTDGVPLFVEELVRTMVESGALEAEGERYVLTVPLSELAIPTSLRDSLVARLDRLGRAKKTAQVAAAIGREFTFELLRATELLDETTAQEDLDKLVSAELVYRKRRLKNPAYLFKHALVRDAAYESMLKRSRQQVHSRIARALEEKFPDTASERPELLAQHHAAAEQKREAIGYAQKAAGHALRRSACAEAVTSATQAIGWLDALGNEKERLDAELALNGIICPAIMSSRGWTDPQIKATAERSHALLADAGDSPHLVPTLWTLMTFHHLGGRERALALSLAERILDIATRSGDLGHQAAAHTAVANCLWIDGNYPLARQHFERMLSLHDAQRDRGHAFIYGQDTRIWSAIAYATILWFQGHPEQAFALAQKTLGWARELNHAGSTALALLYTMILYGDSGQRERVGEYFKELRALTERYGLPAHAAYCGVVNGWASGDPETARQCLGILEYVGCELGLSIYRSLVARAEAAAGQPAQALESIRKARQRAEEVKERYYLAPMHRLEGVFLLACDSSAVQEAEACFRRSLALAREQTTKLFELEAAIELYKLHRQRDPKGEAHALLSAVYASFTEGRETVAQLREAQSLLSIS